MRDLLREILAQYALPVMGTHGVSHWARVLENGLRLADATGADRDVVQLFAVFHDARRRNEAWDDGHGLRGAELAAAMRARWLGLSDGQFELLRYACEHHTDGLTSGDITVRTCWDSDRLDLPRVGIWIEMDKLCTDAAREPDLVRWAARRGKLRVTPERVADEWGIA